MQKKKVLITGGSGTLGRAIIKRATEEDYGWDITIYSRDIFKQAIVKGLYPHIHTVMGDVCNYSALHNAMAGMDIVIHAAATKVIPDSEMVPLSTMEINVMGSHNVCVAAMNLGTPIVVGISTDKACHPANTYGATKYLMEKIFVEYSRMGLSTRFHLVRYGNVLESTGSVVEAWRRAEAEKRPIYMTDPDMTRFWISPYQAVGYVIEAMKQESGEVYIPKMKSTTIEQLAKYVLENPGNVKLVSMRPGEKVHETLLTLEEGDFATEFDDYFVLRPTTSWRNGVDALPPYTSEYAERMTKEELLELLDE